MTCTVSVSWALLRQAARMLRAAPAHPLARQSHLHRCVHPGSPERPCNPRNPRSRRSQANPRSRRSQANPRNPRNPASQASQANPYSQASQANPRSQCNPRPFQVARAKTNRHFGSIRSRAA